MGDEEGLCLIVHDENQSKQINYLEVEIIKKILKATGELPANSTAIITPHRAQRSLLKTELKDYRNSIDIIDTVEKVQGGERDNIIISATVSSLSAISKEVNFLLDLNRSNVAFSRVKKRLIVIVAKTLLDYIPTELEHYEEALLWKELRSRCSNCIFEDAVKENFIKVYTN